MKEILIISLFLNVILVFITVFSITFQRVLLTICRIYSKKCKKLDLNTTQGKNLRDVFEKKDSFFFEIAISIEKIYIPLFKIMLINDILIAVIFIWFLIGGR